MVSDQCSIAISKARQNEVAVGVGAARRHPTVWAFRRVRYESHLDSADRLAIEEYEPRGLGEQRQLRSCTARGHRHQARAADHRVTGEPA